MAWSILHVATISLLSDGNVCQRAPKPSMHIIRHMYGIYAEGKSSPEPHLVLWKETMQCFRRC